MEINKVVSALVHPGVLVRGRASRQFVGDPNMNREEGYRVGDGQADGSEACRRFSPLDEVDVLEPAGFLHRDVKRDGADTWPALVGQNHVETVRLVAMGHGSGSSSSVADPPAETSPALIERVLEVDEEVAEGLRSHGVEVARRPRDCQAVPDLEVAPALHDGAASAEQLRNNHHSEVPTGACLVMPGRLAVVG